MTLLGKLELWPSFLIHTNFGLCRHYSHTKHLTEQRQNLKSGHHNTIYKLACRRLLLMDVWSDSYLQSDVCFSLPM